MMIKCVLCGKEFDPKLSNTVCASCPFSRGCSVRRCPNCGYENTLEKPLLNNFKKARKKTRYA